MAPTKTSLEPDRANWIPGSPGQQRPKDGSRPQRLIYIQLFYGYAHEYVSTHWHRHVDNMTHTSLTGIRIELVTCDNEYIGITHTSLYLY